MVLENFLSTRPLFVFGVFLFLYCFCFCFGGGGLTITFLLYIFGLFGEWGVRGAGLLEIKYLFYINIYLLRNFYTPNYFYFIYYNYYFAGGLWVDCRFRYTVFVLCKCILIGKFLYNQLYFIFIFRISRCPYL